MDVIESDPITTTREDAVVESEPFFGAALKAIACTRNNNDDEDEYATGVLEPAARIRALEQDVGERGLTAAEIAQVLEWLESTFRTKRTPGEEREHYLRALADAAGIPIEV